MLHRFRNPGFSEFDPPVNTNGQWVSNMVSTWCRSLFIHCIAWPGKTKQQFAHLSPASHQQYVLFSRDGFKHNLSLLEICFLFFGGRGNNANDGQPPPCPHQGETEGCCISKEPTRPNLAMAFGPLRYRNQRLTCKPLTT